MRRGKAMRADLAMLKDVDDRPIEPARKKAERKWRNHDVEKRLKEERTKPKPISKEPSAPEIAEIIENEKPDRRGSVIRAQTKFAKDIRAMMEGHSKRNLILHAISIRAQRKRLLLEKLRRLELREAQRVAQQNQGTSNV
jgi:electron transfer flavoprotein alpha subunit